MLSFEQRVAKSLVEEHNFFREGMEDWTSALAWTDLPTEDLIKMVALRAQSLTTGEVGDTQVVETRVPNVNGQDAVFWFVGDMTFDPEDMSPEYIDKQIKSWLAWREYALNYKKEEVTA